MNTKDLAVQVPIIGQPQRAQVPAALLRVRSKEAVFYCGYNQFEALKTFYEKEPQSHWVSLVCECCPIEPAFQGNPQWDQLLPAPANNDSSESVIVESE